MTGRLSPAATIAVQLLRVAGITRRADARLWLLLWAKPPRLSAQDVHDVLSSFPPERPGGDVHYDRDDPGGQGSGRPWRGVRFSEPPEGRDPW